MRNSPDELSKTYEPAAVEGKWYAAWLEAGVFHEEPDPARPPFVISMPPPNITGRAHLGHASTYTAMDVLTRYHRMLGDNADWLPGQDHAAIATEAVIVRELQAEGLTREGLGREAFLLRAWAWREKYGGELYEAFRALGFGPDWQRDRFTLDPGLSAAVAKVFVALYREGLIYRGTRLVNWDPVSRSTLSDAEVEDVERDGNLWYIRYVAADGTFAVEVATTRPETMLGDTAIAVHPEDERYRAIIGKTVIVPLAARPIPVIADAAVERDFGTGAIKVTPAHDPLDNAIGERHRLPMPSVIGFDGAMTEQAPARYVGLGRSAARDAVLRDLEAEGALVRTEPRRHIVPVSSRSGAVVERLLSLQWFCQMESLAAPALAAYRDGRVRFTPERFGRAYEQWLEGIRDWNISRQVWWGHRLPVWYTQDDQPIVAETEEEAHALAARDCGTTELRRDPDTLDTWFSSALWPFSILGWPEQTPELAHWYPNSVLVTGREIIFLWVARMVMLGLKFAGNVPFGGVFIAPLVFDHSGRKMSKSLGNVIDPIDLIERYGADATRFGILRHMRLESQELRFDERYVEKAREFNNKLWNALRYIRALPEGLASASRLPSARDLSLADAWMLTGLRTTVERVSRALDAFEFGVAADELIDFTWYRYCDWYLEATKTSSASASRAPVLAYGMTVIARLLHPLAPFISEEIWQALPHDGRTIVTASWPDPAEIPADEAAAARYDQVRAVVTKVRDLRADLGLAPREKLTLEVPPELDEAARELLTVHANATLVDAPASSAAPSGDPLLAATPRAPAALLRARISKDIARLDAEIERARRKLENPQFVSKASSEIVAKERDKLMRYEDERQRARAALVALGTEDG
ncbi:MAG: valine--tRNA ligase [Candidatus Eremiobacteraeota bacterium]|nr:valine--tRNA ligase [Candidatus Eremiobacteraeota bacterium]MBC5802340.1 valine--tRNA ligase [Candidatus Eremiobacteraeota bacterium]MBC5822721.1 valine--tRNA ligase [Candidatus Eremiobacteraeota bacterium]